MGNCQTKGCVKVKSQHPADENHRRRRRERKFSWPWLRTNRVDVALERNGQPTDTGIVNIPDFCVVPRMSSTLIAMVHNDEDIASNSKGPSNKPDKSDESNTNGGVKYPLQNDKTDEKYSSNQSLLSNLSTSATFHASSVMIETRDAKIEDIALENEIQIVMAHIVNAICISTESITIAEQTEFTGSIKQNVEKINEQNKNEDNVEEVFEKMIEQDIKENNNTTEDNELHLSISDMNLDNAHNKEVLEQAKNKEENKYKMAVSIKNEINNQDNTENINIQSNVGKAKVVKECENSANTERANEVVGSGIEESVNNEDTDKRNSELKNKDDVKKERSHDKNSDCDVTKRVNNDNIDKIARSISELKHKNVVQKEGNHDRNASICAAKNVNNENTDEIATIISDQQERSNDNIAKSNATESINTKHIGEIARNISELKTKGVFQTERRNDKNADNGLTTSANNDISDDIARSIKELKNKYVSQNERSDDTEVERCAPESVNTENNNEFATRIRESKNKYAIQNEGSNDKHAHSVENVSGNRKSEDLSETKPGQHYATTCGKDMHVSVAGKVDTDEEDNVKDGDAEPSKQASFEKNNNVVLSFSVQQTVDSDATCQMHTHATDIEIQEQNGLENVKVERRNQQEIDLPAMKMTNMKNCDAERHSLIVGLGNQDVDRMKSTCSYNEKDKKELYVQGAVHSLKMKESITVNPDTGISLDNVVTKDSKESKPLNMLGKGTCQTEHTEKRSVFENAKDGNKQVNSDHIHKSGIVDKEAEYEQTNTEVGKIHIEERSNIIEETRRQPIITPDQCQQHIVEKHTSKFTPMGKQRKHEKAEEGKKQKNTKRISDKISDHKRLDIVKGQTVEGRSAPNQLGSAASGHCLERASSSTVSLVLTESLEKIRTYTEPSTFPINICVRSPYPNQGPRTVPLIITQKQIKDGTAEEVLHNLENIEDPPGRFEPLTLQSKRSKRHINSIPDIVRTERPTHSMRQTTGVADKVLLSKVPMFHEPQPRRKNVREQMGLERLRKWKVVVQCKEIERIKVDEEEFPGILPPKIRAKWKKKMEERKMIN